MGEASELEFQIFEDRMNLRIFDQKETGNWKLVGRDIVFISDGGKKRVFMIVLVDDENGEMLVKSDILGKDFPEAQLTLSRVVNSPE